MTEYFYENPEHFSNASQNLNIFAVYDGAKELTELLTIYFKEGIERGEYCLWFSPNILTVEKIKNKLREAGVDAEHSLDSSQLEILSANLSPENTTLFASAIKELIGEKYKKALFGGFSGFRTSFDLKNTGDSLQPHLEMCEKAIETAAFEHNKRFTFLCTFPLEDLSGRTMLELMEENGVLIKRNGIWKRLRNLNEELETENIFLNVEESIEAANRTRNGLITNISHELRTPLNSVIGFSDLLLEGAFGSLNTRQSKYVNNILISGKNLLEIINNLLDITRLEAGERRLNYEDVDIASLIGEVRTNLLSIASNKRISIEVKVDTSLERIRADKIKLRQILYNLINSAVKFTPEKGKVNVSAYKKEGILEIKVSDYRMELSKENHERIFIPFTRADSSIAIGYNGAEIGLYAAKTFVELHGGKIWIDSKVGKGSAFIFTLPID
ncbi:MAG: ATP-binding protein [Methanosarcina sp.]|nr:ATP-binding protein [Methanosarcina sp.]